METRFNAIIIGSGLGGLTAGATLAKFGKKVLVLEQHYIPGGCATNFKRKDFIMEVGLHEMNGLHDKDIKAEVFDLLEVSKAIQFVQVPELFHIKSADVDFTFPHGPASALEVLIHRFPDEMKSIRAYFKLLDDLLDEIIKMPQENWKLKLIYPLIPLLYPNIFRSMKLSCGDWLDKHIRDEELKLILTTNILYYGDDPYNLSLIYFAAAQAGYIRGGGYYIKGGSQMLSNYLAHYIESRGGQVLLGKRVEKILVENGQAVGVQFRDAFNTAAEPITIHVDAVVVNAAIPHAVNMLPEAYRSTLENKIKNLEESCSLISIYMGFDIDLKDYGVKYYSTFVLGEDVKSLKDVKPNNRGEWSKKCFVFVDYSQIDAGIAPAGKSFGVICAADYLSNWEGLDDSTYKARKDQVAQLFFARLESHYPGITGHIVYYEVGTAKTIQRYTLNPKGTPYGYAQSPAQSGLGRIAAKSPVRNMFFASAWSFPGGGFSGSIMGGYSAARAMKKAIRWKTHDSALLIDNRIVKLVNKRVIVDQTIELTFEKPDGFQHQAGQYAILRLNNPRKSELDLPFRSLSIVSHPNEPELRFAMRLSESSFKQSCALMEVGEEATVFGPAGKFLLTSATAPMVFLSCGIGITPVIALLKELEKRRFKEKVYLFNSNRTLSSAAYQYELQHMEMENYTYIPVTTSTDKRMDACLLKRYLTDLKNYQYFLVGTSSFLTSMQQLLHQEGVDTSQIKVDDFG